MGDIFRRNAFNLGLEVVQSPEAVRTPRTATVLLRPGSRELRNETRGKTLHAAAADGERGRDPPLGRYLRRRSSRAHRLRRDRRPSSSGRTRKPRAGSRRRSRSSGRTASTRDAVVEPGATLRVYADLLPGLGRHRTFRHPHVQPDHRRRHDLPPPGGDRQRPLRLHRQGLPTTGKRASAASSPASRDSRSRTTRRPATASFTSTSPSRGSSFPGSSFPERIRTAAPTGPTAPSALASARRPSDSAGRRATSTSRSPRRAASSSGARSSPG